MDVTVFIDESGETGISKVRTDGSPGASPYFVMAAAVIPSAAQVHARKVLSELKADFDGKDWAHATDLTHWRTKHLCKRISEINMRLFAVVSNKATLGGYADAIDWEPHRFYNKCAHYLLERVGRYFDGKGLFGCDPKVVFEQRNHDFDALRRYIGKIKDKPIHPDAHYLRCFNPFAISVKAKNEEDLLKVADVTANAVYQCVNLTKSNFGIPETSYLQLLQPRFGADERGRVLGEGLKCIHSVESVEALPEISALWKGMKAKPRLRR